jgi:hypothetical protein
MWIESWSSGELYRKLRRRRDFISNTNTDNDITAGDVTVTQVTLIFTLTPTLAHAGEKFNEATEFHPLIANICQPRGKGLNTPRILINDTSARGELLSRE